MARIGHIALATHQPSATAAFYKEVFGLRELGQVNNENAEGYYLRDGHVKLAVLKFKNANFDPRNDLNSALNSSMGRGHGGRNVELKHSGPDGVMIDISPTGWVGTDSM